MEDKLSLAANFLKDKANLEIAAEVLKAYLSTENTTVLDNLTDILTDYDMVKLNYIPKSHYQQTYFFEVMKNLLGTNIMPNALCDFLVSIPDEYLKNNIVGNLKDKYEVILRQLLYLSTIVRVRNMDLSARAREEIFKLIRPNNIVEVQPVIDNYEKGL